MVDDSPMAQINPEDPIRLERRGPVAILTLNRPRVLNALNAHLLQRLAQVLAELAGDPGVGAVVLTGGERAFAAGADIQEMLERQAADQVGDELGAPWEALARFPKPLVAAVNGVALGGGCELALMCDLIVAGDGASFGQPEIRLGVMPGAGGTQRWTRTVGKQRAMEIVLLGRPVSARRAWSMGLVNRLVPDEVTLEVAVTMAGELAGAAPLALRLAKESVNRALEVGLGEGLAFERRSFSLLFATADQKEGMRAFLERRRPIFEGR